MVNSRAQPFFATASRERRSSSGTGAVAEAESTSPAKATAKGIQGGGRIMAQGLSKSLGAASETINTLRSIGENRLHVPKGSSPIRPGCTRWLVGKENGILGIVGGGVVRVHEVRTKISSGKGGKGGKRQSLVGGHLMEFGIPKLSERPLPAPAADDAHPLGIPVAPGYWNLRPTAAALKVGAYDQLHPLSYAEIETNSPYQPFHTDRRVQLFTYESSGSPASTPGGAGMPGSDGWVFGQEIPSTKIYVGRINTAASQEMSSAGRPDNVLGPMESIVQRGKGAEEVEQLVITTRRRRRGRDEEGGPEDGFFEDDCEVLDFAANRV
ncbi:MAG: hypothetical protein M1826_002504 [Phylliscum demangeonii]|nr:MAG: hypothetical protein M1826_002504 [Phylliscum demangeonii]